MVGIEAQANGLLCVFSNNIPKETKILDNCIRKSLNESALKWADDIMKQYKNLKRQIKIEKLEKANYNIKLEYCKLEKKYNEFIVDNLYKD